MKRIRSFRGARSANPESRTPGLVLADHPEDVLANNSRGEPHADHSRLGRASLPRGGELGETARRLEPHRRRLRRGRQQGPHLRLQSRRPSDGRARPRGQFHQELGRRPVQPRPRAAHRRRRQSLLHRRRRPHRAQVLGRRQGAADHRHPEQAGAVHERRAVPPLHPHGAVAEGRDLRVGRLRQCLRPQISRPTAS